MNKIYEIYYTWRFKNDVDVWGGDNDEYKFAISAHNRMDAIDYFMEHYGEDDRDV